MTVPKEDKFTATIKQNDLREKLALLEHEQWSEFMTHLDKIVIHGETTVEFTLGTWNEWLRKASFHYCDLTEQEKESDRKFADKVLDAYADVLRTHNQQLQTFIEQNAQPLYKLALAFALLEDKQRTGDITDEEFTKRQDREWIRVDKLLNFLSAGSSREESALKASTEAETKP